MLIRTISFSLVIFAAVLAYLIGTRIDQATISLVSGTAIGILVTTPCVAIITWLLTKRRYESDIRERDRREASRVSYHFNRGIVEPGQWMSPQIYGAPQQYPQIPAPEAYPIRQRRQFHVIGDEDGGEE